MRTGMEDTLESVEDGVFVTADKHHLKKIKDFSHIALFKDWETIFEE